MQSRDSKPEVTETKVEPTVEPPKPKSMEERVAALEALMAHVKHITGEPQPTPVQEA